MNDQISRKNRITAKVNLDNLPSHLKKIDIKQLGGAVSEFIHHAFKVKQKSDSLNWCFANIKRSKIFLNIFHANQNGVEIYKEEIAKKIPEYSYKTIAKIIDDGINKKYFLLLPVDGAVGKDAKVKNIRPSEQLMIDFLNLSVEIISFIDKKRV